MLYRVHLALLGFELTTLVVIGIDCIGIINQDLCSYGFFFSLLNWGCRGCDRMVVGFITRIKHIFSGVY